MAILILKFKENVVREYLLGEAKVLIGRSPDCYITIDNPTVTKYHASIEYKNGAHWVTDLQSTNGTSLNGKNITTSQLSDDDRIEIGKHTLVFLATEDLPPENFSGYGDKTIVMGSPKKPGRQGGHSSKKGSPREWFAARLSAIESDRRKEYSLSKDETTFGSGASCTIKVTGFLTPKKLASIKREEGSFYLHRWFKWFTVSVNGEQVTGKAVELKKNDIIQIRSLRYIFKEERRRGER
ncbi:MAG: FHA domain-containing protein [Nitrospinota bacterium]